MLTLLVLIFVVAYAAIALEHPLRINKSASQLRRELRQMIRHNPKLMV